GRKGAGPGVGPGRSRGRRPHATGGRSGPNGGRGGRGCPTWAVWIRVRVRPGGSRSRGRCRTRCVRRPRGTLAFGRRIRVRRPAYGGRGKGPSHPSDRLRPVGGELGKPLS